MLRSIYANIDHLMVPFGMLLGLLAAFIGITIQRKRRAGLEPPYFSKGFRLTATAVVLLGFVFLGMLLVHNLT